MGKCIVSIFATKTETRDSWLDGGEGLNVWSDVGCNTTYHVLMLCLADGDIVREISAVADRLVGSMLLIRVSSTEARRIATAWGVPTNSALKL